ncbi:MarR family winged helix-turn-helix transcriptional regulator [Planctomicrobium sp. SH661]|uniref:MarR family winged helix-turn-helix transcriptional regulator n=1 Tax=Planctomicrobium sp. SH661 TaxID=3448124 RepID=UPI003F5B6423
MKSTAQLDRRAAELGEHVQKILKEFQAVHCSAANGPHVSLNQQELRVVEFLGGEGPQIMRAVAEHLSLAVNSVTTLVDGMEQKSLVVRNRTSSDRRVIRVELTATGTAIWKAAEEAKLELYRSLLLPLSASEQAVFLELFDKIAKSAAPPIVTERV